MYRRRPPVVAVAEPLEARRLLSGSLPGVPDVVEQFNALEHHAEGLAYRVREDLGAPDPSTTEHYQGIVRYPGTGTPVFYVTQKWDNPYNPLTQPDLYNAHPRDGGYLNVIRMGRRDTDGERLRSNLLEVGEPTEDVTPDVADTWISTLHLDGTVMVDGRAIRGYIHPGGMAIQDDVLLVAMDTPVSSSGFGGKGMIVLFDLRENGGTPQRPVPIQALPVEHSIDNLAIAEKNGHFVVWTNGNGGETVYVYRTEGDGLRDPSLALDRVQFWNRNLPLDMNGDWPTGTGGHQSSTFIRQADGRNPDPSAPLYMIGMRTDPLLVDPLHGDDVADLYRVTIRSDDTVHLDHIASKQFTLRYDEAGNLGNFAAASGAYVSPTGELILYSSPHDDEDGFTRDSARIAEIRHRDVVRPTNPLRNLTIRTGGPYTVTAGGSVQLYGVAAAPKLGPWVELFEGPNFTGRSVVIDYRDRSKFELDDFEELDDFGDTTRSARWYLPLGMRVELYADDHYGGNVVTLAGNGSLGELSTLGGNNDRSSMRFLGTPPTYAARMEWDLDGDGVMSETGAAALRGDEVGSSPTYRANSVSPGAVLFRGTAIDTGEEQYAIVPLNVVPVQPPTPGTAPDLADSSDRGFSNTDNVTNLTTPRFIASAGTAYAGWYVRVFVDGQLYGGPTVVPASGNCIVNPGVAAAGGLTDGVHLVQWTLAQTQTSAQGGLSPGLNFTIDTVRPLLTSTRFAYEGGHQIRFDFDENVYAGQGPFPSRMTAVNLTTGQTVPSSAYTAFTFGSFAAWSVDGNAGGPGGKLPDGNYEATLTPFTIIDTAGNFYDPPAVNEFFVLAGDANRNRTVGPEDFNILASNFGKQFQLFPGGDFDYDGTVGPGDFNLLASRFGTTLAPPAAASLSEGVVPRTEAPAVKKKPVASPRALPEPLTHPTRRVPARQVAAVGPAASVGIVIVPRRPAR